MAYKEFVLDESISVTIYKRKSSRSLRLTVAADGKVKVSIPTWTPYRAGLEFARSRKEWIARQQTETSLLQTGKPIGKAHRLLFLRKSSISKPTARIAGGEIIVSYPMELEFNDSKVQKAAKDTSVKALRLQAEKLLPQRLQSLASKHDFTYSSVSIKMLKGRWGSCDQQQNIILNLYLMQLPWDLIDYVLLHELTHTRILRHGPDFWSEMEKTLPEVKQARKQIKTYQPILK